MGGITWGIPLSFSYHLFCQQFDGVTKLFGEDSKATQPEDFFGTFDMFIDTFRDVKRDLENMKKKEEEEERKKKEAEVGRFLQQVMKGRSWRLPYETGKDFLVVKA